ncbi:hypothetical protein BDW_07285 [Bdellovibrio bacteriovorus W]|nr:hypothetical protein BDW_07285 [Bdellovibrio bacteriovorus W]
MSTLVADFKKYQKKERTLTVAIVLASVAAPIASSVLLNMKVDWVYALLVGVSFLAIAVWFHLVRSKVSQRLIVKYEALDIGSVLAKKISTATNHQKFVITNTGYNHFYIRCLNTGEQSLVSKHRVREDFDIAN